MIPLPVNLVCNMFGDQLNVFDRTHVRGARGFPGFEQSNGRSISGVIQPAGDDALRGLPEGFSCDGALVLHTADAVHVASNHEGASSAPQMQTYVRHDADVWKAWALQGWGPHTNIRRYLLTRFIDGNVTIS